MTHNEAEETRGYQTAQVSILSGGDPQKLYDTSVGALNQDYFDRGWQRACEEHGAKDND